MGFFGLWRGHSIRESEALGDFLDQAIALGREVVEDYARGRAGTDADALFADAAFLSALERARWEAYPLLLAMLAELVEGVLRPQAADEQMGMLYGLEALVLAVFDRHPVPPALTAQAWIAARGDVLRSLADLPLHPPKPAADIVESYAPSILALMPVHDLLRGEDFAALRNDLRAMLMRLHDQFVRLARPAALVAALLRRR